MIIAERRAQLAIGEKWPRRCFYHAIPTQISGYRAEWASMVSDCNLDRYQKTTKSAVYLEVHYLAVE